MNCLIYKALKKHGKETPKNSHAYAIFDQITETLDRYIKAYGPIEAARLDVFKEYQKVKLIVFLHGGKQECIGEFGYDYELENVLKKNNWHEAHFKKLFGFLKSKF